MYRKLREFAWALRAGADASRECRSILQRFVQNEMRRQLEGTPRFQDPRRLLRNGYKVYSQNDEDGMIAEIFHRIGTTTKRFIEFGVEDGLETNSTFLLSQGWNGCWIEASKTGAARARQLFSTYPVEVVEARMTVENADSLIGRLAGPGELDLLSIDIDSNDYWIWKAITSVKPRVVVIEYNATFPPFVRKTIDYNPNFDWDGSNYFGASLGALAAIGAEKGYSLVGCCAAGVNAFFVRSDLVKDHFCSPFTAENHYEPARYQLATRPSGHRAGIGPWVDV